MNKKIKLILKIIICISNLFLFQICFAEILTSGWEDSAAYKPRPVLFLHGFGRGNTSDWDYAKASLSKYFSKYSNSFGYLETLPFSDPNGSIDTYDPGKLNPEGNSQGWSDKVQSKVNTLLSFSKYGAYTTKLNLVCHSMGGLAARWYLVDYSNNYVDKCILIGTPNLGSGWATLAVTISKVPNIGWMNLLPVLNTMSLTKDELAYWISIVKDIDIQGEAVKDMDITLNGSGFLSKLNNIPQPVSISYFGIIGEVGTLMNWVASGSFDYSNGDGMVSRDSQLGVVGYKQTLPIKATHGDEPKIAANVNWPKSEISPSNNIILKFLDSTPPEFTLDSPLADSNTIVNDDFINVKGKVYKEYLPADSKLHIEVTKVNDGSPVINEDRAGAIKASGLWQANNPDSPVAEFDEKITLPGEGVYSVKLKIINPAEIPSEEQSFAIVVMAPTDWRVGPYAPEFPAQFAGWLSSENILALYFSPNPPSLVYPWASMNLEDISTARVGVPYYTSGIVVVINETTEFGADYDYPCEIIFSRLELKNGGYVSGTITGQLRGDPDGDGNWDLYDFHGKFNNVQVFQQSSSSYSLKMKQFQLNSTRLKAVSRFSIKK